MALNERHTSTTPPLDLEIDLSDVSETTRRELVKEGLYLLAERFGIRLDGFGSEDRAALTDLDRKIESLSERLPPQTMGQAATRSTVASLPEWKDEQQAATKEKWLTLGACAELSGRSITTIRRATKGGVLKAHTVARGRKRPSYRVRLADLQQYIEAGRVEIPDPPNVPTTPVRKKSRHFD